MDKLTFIILPGFMMVHQVLKLISKLKPISKLKGMYPNAKMVKLNLPQKSQYKIKNIEHVLI